MIDWWDVLANSLWIIGLAVAVATLSYAAWGATVEGEKTTAWLKRPALQTALQLAVLLVCLGLAGTSSRLWVTILWLVLAVAILAQTIMAIRIYRHKGHEEHQGK
jgi:hypothetical protein